MTRTPNYDDLVGLKTHTQKQKTGMVQALLSDMKRIDATVASGSFEELKKIHIEMDGTYQNRIRNWGTSMYNYIKEMGFTYEYIDEDALSHNLRTMKAKIRGLLLDIAPDYEEAAGAGAESDELESVCDATTHNTNEEPVVNTAVVRRNMYDIVNSRRFDAAKEYARIWMLFNSGETVGPRVTSLAQHLDGCIQFFPDSFKKRALTLVDFNNTCGFSFNEPNESITKDELISYCEYVITLCDHLWEYADIHLDDDAEYLRDDLYQIVESCMDELGLEAAKRDFITIYVEKDPTVVAVADLVNESLVYDVKSYIHNRTKGDLHRKKTILKFLADEIEPQRNVLNGINKVLASSLFQMLQKFVRHNNEDNAYISNMTPEEVEACYDDIYQLWILAMLEIGNIERRQRVKQLLGDINTPA